MGRIKMFLGIFVIVAGVYVSAKLIPPYFSNYQFQDSIKEEATRDSYAAKTESDIQDTIFKKAQDYDIPITKEGIHVEHQGNQFSGTIIIRAPYTVHVDLPAYPLDLHFEPSTLNRGVF